MARWATHLPAQSKPGFQLPIPPVLLSGSDHCPTFPSQQLALHTALAMAAHWSCHLLGEMLSGVFVGESQQSQQDCFMLLLRMLKYFRSIEEAHL